MFPDWSPTTRHCGLLLAVLTLLVLVTAVGAGHTASDTPPQYDDHEADFATAHGIWVTTGETAVIQVETNGYWTVDLTLHGGDDDIALELTDSDDDGRVTLRLNTAVAADPNQTVSSAFTLIGDGDEMRFRKPDRGATTPVLQPERYSLILRVSGNRHGSTGLHIEERWPTGQLLNSSTVQYENLTSTVAVDGARQDGRLTRTENMREGDVLALRINSSVLAAAMEDANGTNATARFRSLLAGNETRLFFQQTDSTTHLKPLYGFASDAGRMRVVSGTSAQTYYVLFDTTTMPGRYCSELMECDSISESERLFEQWRSFRANFTLDGDPVVGYNEDLHISVVETPMDDTTDPGTNTTPAVNETSSEETPTQTSATVTTASGVTPAETESTPNSDSNETVTPPSATGTRTISTTTGTGPGFAILSTLLTLVCSVFGLRYRLLARN